MKRELPGQQYGLAPQDELCGCVSFSRRCGGLIAETLGPSVDNGICIWQSAA